MNPTSRTLTTLVMLGASLGPALGAAPPGQAAPTPATPTQTVLPDAYAGATSQAPPTIHPMGTVKPVSDQAQRTALVDQMLKAGGSNVSAPDRAQIEKHLDQVPTDVLQTVAKTGTRIVVMQPGQTPADVGLIHAIGYSSTLSQPQTLQRYQAAADKAFAAAHAQYGSQIASLQKQLNAAKAVADRRAPAQPPAPTSSSLGLLSLVSTPEGQELMDPTVQSLNDQLGTVQGKAMAMAWDQLMQTTGLQVEPWTPPPVDESSLAALQASMQPVTLEGIAQSHGAKTPAEVQQFVSEMQALNGPHLTRLQADAVQGDALAKASQGLPVAQRPFHPDNSVLVPNQYYYRTTGQANQQPVMINNEDWDSINGWKQDVVGEYYQSSNTILYQSGHLDRNGEGSDTPDHEMGHAYKNALQKLDPQFYNAWNDKWQAHFNDSNSPNRFPTGYSQTNEDEYYAEDFAAYFGGHRNLVTADPAGTSLLQQSLTEAAHLAKP